MTFGQGRAWQGLKLELIWPISKLQLQNIL